MEQTVTIDSHQYKRATVFGGTGFIGRQIVRELARAGYTVKVATRLPESAYFLRPCGGVGQVVPFAVDYSDPASIGEAVRGADVVVTSIGMLYQPRKGTFQKLFVEIPRMVAAACMVHNVERYIHISALGIEDSKAKYARAKRDGEEAVRGAFPAVTILRPSVVFGPDDNFFNMFAELARFLPVLPLIGGGKTKFQPVYVGDVADAVMAAASLPPLGPHDPRGKTYALGGPEIVSFRDVYERIFRLTRRKRGLLSLPWALAKIQAAFMALLPKPLLTPDQVELLKTDNVVPDGMPTLADLGIAPTGMNLILPGYLAHYAPGGRLGAKKRA